MRSTVPTSCAVLGNAVSGHTEMHSMHWVQFSGTYTGVSRRATYLDCVAPVAAAMMPTDASALAGWWYPSPARNSRSKVSRVLRGERASCASGKAKPPLPQLPHPAVGGK